MLLCDGNHILRGAVALDAVTLTTAAEPAPDLSLPPGDGPLSTLTPREAEVLRRITAGQNTKKMAGEMNVTTETLRTYVKKVLAKLGAHSRLEAATLASRHITQGWPELDQDQPLFAALTPREREVLAHLTKGSELRDVARQLHMSLRTVNTHLQNLRGKLGVHSTLEAVALARARLAQRPEATDPGGPA
jgi:DNA-binding NarL/FixJ family response regulator